MRSMLCSYKSTVAATAANAINPAMNIRALQNRVSPETEDVFNDSFWEVSCISTLSFCDRSWVFNVRKC